MLSSILNLSVLLFMQDAHEFLNFLLNELVDILEKEAQAAKSDHESSSPHDNVANGSKSGAQANGTQKEPLVTWVHKNFQVNCFWISFIQFSKTLFVFTKYICDYAHLCWVLYYMQASYISTVLIVLFYWSIQLYISFLLGRRELMTSESVMKQMKISHFDIQFTPKQ